jgi:hypothetical protein
MKAEIVTEAGDTPEMGHGGLARPIVIKLVLNGVTLMTERRRIAWTDSTKIPKTEASWEMAQVLKGINAALAAVPVGEEVEEAADDR